MLLIAEFLEEIRKFADFRNTQNFSRFNPWIVLKICEALRLFSAQVSWLKIIVSFDQFGEKWEVGGSRVDEILFEKNLH